MTTETPREQLRTAMDHLAAAHARIGYAVSEIEDILDATENTDQGTEGFTIPCDHCSKRFDPSSVHHVILGPGSARYSCPNCNRVVRGPPPKPDTDD